jgi:hypothetical protein
MVKFRIGIALSLAALLALSLASSASAFHMIKLTGHYGDFGTSLSHQDSPDGPGARCGYSAADATGVAHLAWVKLFALKAIAYDRTGAVDHQKIRFTATLQRSGDGGSTWKNVSSVSETRTAYDNKSASFDALTVATTGTAGKLYRAVATLQWLRNGQVDGLAKLRMDYYSVKWTVGDPAYVFSGSCDGTAD